MVWFPTMLALTEDERQKLLGDIVSRQYPTKQLAKMYGCTTADLRKFVDMYKDDLEGLVSKTSEQTSKPISSEPTPEQLDDLWVSQKFERLKRIQRVADDLFKQLQSDVNDAVALREFRAYMVTAANELGQLMHRGSGDAGTGDSLAIEIPGIDMESMR